MRYFINTNFVLYYIICLLKNKITVLYCTTTLKQPKKQQLYVLYSVYCTLCTVLCVLYSVYCTLCTVLYVLYSVYCTLCTVLCVLYSMYCTLCTVLCVLYSMYMMTGRWQLALRRRRVPPVGLRAAPSHAMALPSRRRSFGMGYASDMAGLHLGCPAPACVRSPSPSHTLCHAHSAGFHQSATTRSATPWLAR